MRVAVPLFNRDIAPRFGFADTFLIADITNNDVVKTQQVSIDIGSWASRLTYLQKLKVEVLLCGGFNRSFVPLAEELQISILAGLTGDAHQTVEAYARGETIPSVPCSGMRHRRRSGRECESERKTHKRSKQ